MRLTIITLVLSLPALGACAAVQSPIGPSIDTPTRPAPAPVIVEVDIVEANVPSGTEPPAPPTTLGTDLTAPVADPGTDEWCYPLIADGVGGCVDPPAGGVLWQEPGATDESCYPQGSDGVNCVNPPAGGTPGD